MHSLAFKLIDQLVQHGQYSGVLIIYTFIFLPENTKCMYFCVIRQESEWTNKNSTVHNQLFYAQQNLTVGYAGLVPEPARQVAEARQHQEGAGAAGPQRAPADLQRGADPPRGDREAGATTQREEADATGDTSSLTNYISMEIVTWELPSGLTFP